MRIRSSIRSLTVLSSIFVLGGCSYTMESSNQDITFMSPDAQDAKCLVYVNKRKYQVFPPQTINIKKSDKDMEVTCHAPGNRTVEITVPAKFEMRAIWGTPAGMAWDYASQSSHSYPDVIAIDFSQEELLLNPLPKHNNDDIMQPESHDLEEFVPSEPLLNKDKDEVESLLMRKGDSMEEIEEDIIIEVEDEVVIEEADEGSLESVLEDLRETPTEELKEQDSSMDDAVSGPVELLPGE